MSIDYNRIEKAIHYLDENVKHQPSLAEVAQHVHLSAFHFQRLFRRWAGISPKRFLQFLTIDHAKEQLRASRGLLDVTYDTGLSSLGRIHDLFVTLEAVTPGEFKNRGRGVAIQFGIHPSPFGDCFIAVTDRGICGMSFIVDGDREAPLHQWRQRWPQASISHNDRKTAPIIKQIFQSEADSETQSVSLFLSGSNFQLKVWEALLRIPPGAICSYQQLAASMGKPNGAQAVGQAVAANPVAYIIPCHRVIRQVGRFGAYRWGAARKKAILGWEAARSDRSHEHQMSD